MGWLIVLCIVALLMLTPLGISGIYSKSGALIQLILGPIRLKLYPNNKKQKKEKESSNKVSSESSGNTKDKDGGSIKDFLPILNFVLDLLSDVRKKIRVNILELKVILAGGDPSDLAVNYGNAWAAIGALMPRLQDIFVIKKQNIEVECDFVANQTLIFARLDITITVGRIFTLGFKHGIKLVREYFKIVNQRKGGANL